MTSKLSYFAALSSNPLLLCCIPLALGAACGTDERIQGVNQTGGDSGAGEDDDSDPFGDDDADDDTGPVPTSRPTTTPTTTPTTPTTPAVTSNLGFACSANGDCDAGLECMTEDSSGFWNGGPANGMCTAACASDLDCLAIDSNGVCVPADDTGTAGVCMPGCVAGDLVSGADKCGGRLDMACLALDTISFCVPMCGSDADCAEGRFCDIGFGNCVDEPLTGDAIGSECDPAAEQSDCSSGFCLGLGAEGTFGMCSGACRTGTVGCGSGSLMPEDPGEGFCLPLGGVGLDGDFGTCIQRCNCDLDCLHPGALCWAAAETDEEAIADIGTVGFCIDGAFQDDPEFADERIGIECEDDRDPPTMTEAGVPPDGGSGGSSSLPMDSGSNMTPLDSGNTEPEPSPDAASADGG